MAELYVKPGNRERGWNDPPQFSYGLQQQQQQAAAGPQSGGGGRGAKRGPLTRRPAQAGGGGGRPPPPPPQEPESAIFSPALSAFPPKSVGLPPSTLPDPSLQTDALEAEGECCVEDILSPLNEALDNCRKSVQKQVCDDISKRLAVLKQIWAQGKLSAPVRRGMRILTEELKRQHWDAADEIHRSLMVDHIHEVSQWMVGVKRLIAETRKLPAVDPALEEQEAENQPESER